MQQSAILPRLFGHFFVTQAKASLFGGAMLAGIILSRMVWQPDWPIARYDALVLWAVALQVLFLRLGLETWAEARVILLFHLTGTGMEWFKVAAGSWSYPEDAILKIMGVPLFSGFMYAAVGSYIARVIRLSDMVFAPFPPLWAHFLLALAIYVNFFAHHWLPDARNLLFAATLLLYGRTRIWFDVGAARFWMPLPVAALLVAFFLWVAENVGTATGTWLYAGAAPWQAVDLAKMGSWYLLLYVSFATVTLVFRDALRPSRGNGQTRPDRQKGQ